MIAEISWLLINLISLLTVKLGNNSVNVETLSTLFGHKYLDPGDDFHEPVSEDCLKYNLPTWVFFGDIGQNLDIC